MSGPDQQEQPLLLREWQTRRFAGPALDLFSAVEKFQFGEFPPDLRQIGSLEDGNDHGGVFFGPVKVLFYDFHFLSLLAPAASAK